MKHIILFLMLTTCSSASANDMKRIYILGAQMCDKAFMCTQNEFDSAAQKMPHMRGVIKQMKDQFAKQCKTQHEHKYVASYAQPKEIDPKLMSLTVGCFEKQANAGCEYYTGERDFEEFPECKSLFNYHQ